jgi:hypothetical protein
MFTSVSLVGSIWSNAVQMVASRVMPQESARQWPQAAYLVRIIDVQAAAPEDGDPQRLARHF